jgi:outer membrane receptor protein involved in Fe transport
MVYGRIATGYRPGGPNAPTPAAPRYVNSDSLVNYELGLKSTWLNDRVMFDATLFAVDWKDVQLNAVRGGYSYLANGGDAKSSGLELSTSWVPADGLVLSANLAYTKSELKSVIAESNFVKGYQLPGVPKLAGSLNADYAWSPTPGWTTAVGGNWRYVGKQWMTGVQVGPSAAPTVEAPSYQLVNLYASATHNAVKYKLFVTNLANETAQQGGIALIDLGNNPVQGDVYIAKPRTVGLGIDISFN